MAIGVKFYVGKHHRSSVSEQIRVRGLAFDNKSVLARLAIGTVKTGSKMTELLDCVTRFEISFTVQILCLDETDVLFFVGGRANDHICRH